jgi:hypothetical protein
MGYHKTGLLYLGLCENRGAKILWLTIIDQIKLAIWRVYLGPRYPLVN